MARQAMAEKMRREWRHCSVRDGQHRRLALFAVAYQIEFQDALELALEIARASGIGVTELPTPEDKSLGRKSMRVVASLHDWMKEEIAKSHEVLHLQDIMDILIEHGLGVMEGGDLGQFVQGWLCTQGNMERVDKFALAMRRLGEELGDGKETNDT